MAANQVSRNEGVKGQGLRGREHPRKERKKEAEGGTSTLSPVRFRAPSLLCPRPESAREERCSLHSPGPRDTPSGACSSLQSPSALPRSLRRKGRAGKASTFGRTKAQSEQETAQGHTTSLRVGWKPGLLESHPNFSTRLHLNIHLRGSKGRKGDMR